SFYILDDQTDQQIYYIAEFVGDDIIREEKTIFKKDKLDVKSPLLHESRHLQSELKFESEDSPSKLTYTSGRGNNVLIYEGHRYIKNNTHSGKVYWKCTKWHSGCKARAITNRLTPDACLLKNTHNHDL
ncbi:uncharacterized protein LOC131430494, partial [Malaya genurostris]|uniref:uncharacterized protein LOC131430494 n=1 Tax=Malaya genurostris TaxID=325434 RepID=UPI0026F3BA6C